ncbi:MAG: hypothetical protein ACMZ7B_09215 [Balneola sp.]
MKLFNFGALSVLIITMLGACAASGPAVSDSSSVESIFPSWYAMNGFSSDSVSYLGFATAIAADSTVAVERAEKQARINLEKNIALLTEEIRTDLVKSGSNNADNTDFIIILRTAHSGVEAAASSNQTIVRNTEGYYRGFASVEITRAELRNVLEKGFTGHPRYWGEFSSAQGFAVHF